MSIISLVMVLVRKHYFRVHCSQLLKNDYLRRTNTIMPDHQSFFSRTFTLNPASPGARSGRSSTKSKPRDKRVSRLQISGPSDARAMGSVVPDEEDGRVPRELAESPTSFHRSRVSFRPSTENQAGSGSIDGPTAQGSVDEEQLLEVHPTPSTGLSHTRTIQLPEPQPNKQFQARQRIRSQSRAMSLGVGPSPKTVLNPINQTVTMPSPLPRPDATRHSGMGGFSTPTQWLPYLLPHRARSSISRHFSRPNLERQTTILTNAYTYPPGEDDWSDTLMTGLARWMPDTLTSLVVGRNSRFFTEELDDDDLEQIGGVEYRALRLLSYFVSAVSPYSIP